MSSQLAFGVLIIFLVSRLSQTSPQPDYESRCESIGQENKISDQSILSVDQILINTENECEMICKTSVLTIIPKPLDGISDELISEKQAFTAVLEDDTSCGDNKICRDGKCILDASGNDSQTWSSHLMSLDRKKRQSGNSNTVSNTQNNSASITVIQPTAATTTCPPVAGKRRRRSAILLRRI